MQNGVVCITLVIRKDCNQLLSWSDPNGQSGLVNVLRVVAKLLQNEDESGGLVIGDLIIHLFRRAGESVLPVLPELLQAMVARMISAKTATFLQVKCLPGTSNLPAHLHFRALSFHLRSSSTTSVIPCSPSSSQLKFKGVRA